MKYLYKFAIPFILIVILSQTILLAQWCEPLVEPYGPTMPGITHFTLNTIDRTSAALENSTDNFTFTDLSTTLQKGETYSISITHTVDASICPDMNIRVYIDYNLDYTFEDPGETILSIDHHAPGTYIAPFTVPATAITGATRLRATVKMSNLGGHTLPTPCDIPADPIGYHGEMEDYVVNLVSTTGINTISSPVSNINLFPNPVENAVSLTYTNSTYNPVSINLYNIEGERIRAVPPKLATLPGVQQSVIDCSDLPDGIYMLTIECDGAISYGKVVIGR